MRRRAVAACPDRCPILTDGGTAMGGSGADNDPDSVPTPSLVTVAEAARLSGRSTEALRKAIGRGRLKARRSNNGVAVR